MFGVVVNGGVSQRTAQFPAIPFRERLAYVRVQVVQDQMHRSRLRIVGDVASNRNTSMLSAQGIEVPTIP
jgi:hypothetical protein